MRFEKAKTDFARAAQEAGKADKVRDFKLINAQSVGVEAPIRNAVAGLKKLPAVEVVKAGDNAFWVINAASKEEPTYRPFAQVKMGIEQYLKKEKLSQAVEEKINQLKGEYNVAVNEEYFKAQQPSQGEAPVQAGDEVALAESADEAPRAA